MNRGVVDIQEDVPRMETKETGIENDEPYQPDHVREVEGENVHKHGMYADVSVEAKYEQKQHDYYEHYRGDQKTPFFLSLANDTCLPILNQAYEYVFDHFAIPVHILQIPADLGSGDQMTLEIGIHLIGM